MEAEYIAAAAAAQEDLSLRSVLRELGFSLKPVQLGIDNSAAIDFTKNPLATSRAKHIDIRYHYMRDTYLMACVIHT